MDKRLKKFTILYQFQSKNVNEITDGIELLITDFNSKVVDYKPIDIWFSSTAFDRSRQIYLVKYFRKKSPN